MARKTTRWAEQLVQATAGEIARILSSNPLEQGGYAKVSEHLRQQLRGDIEYLTLIGQDYRAVVHTNPFREGRKFEDEVGKMAAHTDRLLTQTYHRDTGETLYDISCPVQINGRKVYALRLGLQKTGEASLYKNVAATLAPALAAIVVVYAGGAGPAALLGGLAVAAGGGLVSAFWLKRSQERILDLAKAGMRSVINGDLTFHKGADLRRYGEVRKQDSFGQLGLEATKLSMGLAGLINQLKDISSQVSSSSSEQESATGEIQKAAESMAASSQEVSANAQEQEGAMDEVREFMERISQNLDQLNENMRKARDFGEENAKKGEEGKREVQNSKTQMEEIRGAFRSSEQAMKELAEKSEQIGQIIGAITDISDQTNLLALNAAIEAARAGEHGKGFAVVAEQVKSLAESSNRSAQEIMDIVRETQNKIDEVLSAIQEGGEVVDKGAGVISDTGDRLQEIIASVQEMTGIVQKEEQLASELTRDSNELVQKTRSVNETVSHTSNAMQDIAATIEEQNAMVEEINANANKLAEMAGQMDQLVKKFRL